MLGLLFCHGTGRTAAPAVAHNFAALTVTDALETRMVWGRTAFPFLGPVELALIRRLLFSLFDCLASGAFATSHRRQQLNAQKRDCQTIFLCHAETSRVPDITAS